MPVNLAQEVAAKVAALPWEQQRALLRLVETMAPPVAEPTATHDPYTMPALVTDKAERARLLQELVEDMANHPLTGNPPRLTREELHERR
jgi:hypothetical protein